MKNKQSIGFYFHLGMTIFLSIMIGRFIEMNELIYAIIIAIVLLPLFLYIIIQQANDITKIP